jgi:hypothetical protein
MSTTEKHLWLGLALRPTSTAIGYLGVFNSRELAVQALISCFPDATSTFYMNLTFDSDQNLLRLRNWLVRKGLGPSADNLIEAMIPQLNRIYEDHSE